jgi:hypothetical protein
LRIVQPIGARGSLKWLQKAVAEKWDDLDGPLLAALPGATVIQWRSPLEEDDFAEYRDAAFLRRVGLDSLTAALKAYWPRGGPQWDGLALSDAGHVILVEAKAHIGEFCSPPSQASSRSRVLIDASLQATASAIGVVGDSKPAWGRHFYQYANRLAHLRWLRDCGVDAKLVLIGFIDDHDMPGRTTSEAWEAAYLIAHHVLGLPSRHALARHVIHLHPTVDGRA